MSTPPIRKIKKFLPVFLIGGILSFYSWLIITATHIQLPDVAHPVLFYSNQTRSDIKLTFYQALKRAHQSIYLCVYGVSDPQILELLASKSQENVSVLVEYDLSASGSLKKKLPLPALAHPLKTKGLMHKKIVVIDHALVLLGSANLTASSLRHHANLVLGLHHPGLAAFLENPPSPTFTFYSHEQKGEIFLLPSSNEAGLARLIEAIALAKKRIRIAMFTLTHPTLATALILAKQRGVHVTVAVDYYTAKGASKKTLAALQEQGVEVILSQGRELLHHKWALIDKETLVMGSANWTKAAFSKNADFLLFFSPLKKEQTVFLDKLWDIIESESVSN